MDQRPLVPDPRRLGRTGLEVRPIGFGAFKIGRTLGAKYARGYDLPDEGASTGLLNGVLDLGIDVIDTAPAYGLSEERIGRAIAHRRREYHLCTKVGEHLVGGVSRHDFSSSAIRRSVRESLQRLQTDAVDVLLLHSDGNDLAILQDTDAAETLCDLREAGFARAVGFSGKTVEGAQAALAWADVLMVEYSPAHRGHETVIRQAGEAGVGILVKKGLASGHLPPSEAIPFVLANRDVGVLVVGGLDLAHLREDLAIAAGGRTGSKLRTGGRQGH